MDEISLIELFREDADGQLDLLSERIVEVERAATPGEALTVCMRAAHSLKGAARVVGLDAVVRIAHAMEEAFQAARDGRIRLTPVDGDRLLAAVDLVRRLSRVAEPELDAWLTSQEPVVATLVETLTAIGQGRDTPEDPSAIAPAPAPGSVPLPLPLPVVPGARAPALMDPGRSVGAIKVTPEAVGRLMALSAEVAVELRQLERHVETLSGIGRSLALLSASLRPPPGAPPPPALAQLDAIGRSFGEVRTALEQLAADSRRAADDLHHDVLATRLRPFSDITAGLPRLTRDLARQLGKEVRLVLNGTDTAVDRDILGALDAPLGHLVRNALDHGMETPEGREAVGKAPEGRLTISAAHRGGALVVRVEDDGRGIDAEKVRARAVSAGLVDASMAGELAPDEVLEFLFLPGFSTAGTVTDVSGRGVGLDVVQAMVQASGGSVRVSTVQGEGTTISLHLPVTRSVLRCLLVRIGGEPFALPLSHVDRLVRVVPAELVTVEGRACVRMDDATVGLVPAAQVLSLPDAEPQGEFVHVVVLSDRGHRHGLEVEAFLGERDLVVRPLDARLGTVPDVLAASLLDDGTPIVILDPDDLVRSIDEDLGGDRLRRMARAAPAATAPARRILVVDDSLTVREVERQLLEAQGYRVEVAVDGAAGWNALRMGGHDLLLTDVDMPRMNGIELTRRVRADPRLGRLPVVIVSYKDREADRLAGLDAGADRYLTKASFTDDSLIAAVADLLSRAG